MGEGAKKKVAIVVADLHYGGVARIVAETVKRLSTLEKFELNVIVYDDSPINFAFSPVVKVHRVNVPLIAHFGKTRKEVMLRKLRRLLLLPFGLLRLRRLLQAVNPDIIVSHGLILNIFCLLLKGKNKLIVVDHAHPADDLSKKPLSRYTLIGISRWLYRKADKLVAISRLIEDYYLNGLGLGREKVVYIPNCVDFERVRALALEDVEPDLRNLFTGGPVVISAGRFTRPKGQWHLVRAFKRVKEKVQNAKLLLIGTGELKEALVKLTQEAGIGEAVVFLGWQENPFKYIARASIFAFPSLWEGFPLALLEALTCGVPVIASDIPPLREILSPSLSTVDAILKQVEHAEYGVLVPRFDGVWRAGWEELSPEELALAEAIISLLSEEEKRLYYSRKGPERAGEFSVERIVKKWEELLTGV